MSYRPFRNIGRCLVAACAVSLGVATASAQSTLPNAPNPSRIDLFAGFSYYGAHGCGETVGRSDVVGGPWSSRERCLLLQ